MVAPFTPEVLEVVLTVGPSQGPILATALCDVRQGFPVVPLPSVPVIHQTDEHLVILLSPTRSLRVLRRSVRVPTLSVVTGEQV